MRLRDKVLNLNRDIARRGMFSSAGDSAGAVADREVGPDVDSPNPMVDEEENNAH